MRTTNDTNGHEIQSTENTEQHPVVDVTDDGSKMDAYCKVTWNVRCMNQGKLQVVKQEVSRVNTDILGISELKWTGMDEFNSDDHYIYYHGQEEMEQPSQSTKESEMQQYLDAISKTTE